MPFQSPIDSPMDCTRVQRSKTPWVALALLAVSTACLTWSACVWVNREATQASAESEFEKLVEGGRSSTPTTGAQKTRIGPVAKLEIARIGVGGFVEEGLDSRTLRKAIGMSRSGARPGEAGNVVLAAHRDTFFAGLRSAKSGDLVVLRTVDGLTHRYRISKMFVVDPQANWVMKSSPKRRMLTLITCYPFRYVGNAPQRFIVQADPVVDEGRGAAFGRKRRSTREVLPVREYARRD